MAAAGSAHACVSDAINEFRRPRGDRHHDSGRGSAPSPFHARCRLPSQSRLQESGLELVDFVNGNALAPGQIQVVRMLYWQAF